MLVRSHWTRRLAVLFGLLLLAGLVVHFDGRAVLLETLNVDLGFLALTAAAIGLSVTLGALNVYWLFAPRPEFSFRSFLPVYWTGWAVGLVVPGQVGDIASIGLMLKRRGIRSEVGVGLLLLDKMISFAVMVLYAVYGLWSVSAGLSLGEDRLNLMLGMGLTVSAAVVAVRMLAPQSRVVLWAGSVLRTVRRTVAEYPRLVLRNALLTVVKILLMGLAYFLIFYGLGVQGVGLVEVVCLAMASGLVAYIPISFNGIGTVELAGVFLFSQLGIAPPLVLAAYLSLRVTSLLAGWIPATLWIAGARRVGQSQPGW